MERLTTLTDEHRAAMPAHARRWIEVGWRTREANWAAFEDAAQHCYQHTSAGWCQHAGAPWPGRVVRVPSPMAGALAAPIAAYRLAEVRDRSAVAAIREVRWAMGEVARRALGDELFHEVYESVGWVVSGAVDGAVGGPVTEAVRDAMRGAVDEVLGGTVSDTVKDAVRAAAGDWVDVTAADGLAETLLNRWHHKVGGQHELVLTACGSFFRDIVGVEPADELWERDRAFQDTYAAAGWWWPYRRFVMVADRPRVLHLEQVGPAGLGSHRLHHATGPAIAWPDGWALHYWHGIRVPADLVEHGWPVERIVREDNVEIRRCAIERLGWDRFIADANLRPVGPAVADPGNPGQTLTLYDVPEQVFGAPARVLLCTNGTPDRDGTRRRYGLLVPANLTNPVAAAAWTYDWPRDTYQSLARRA